MRRLEDIAAEARATAAARRRVLVEAGEEQSCVGCVGTCCTFVANSMQITALEALDAWTVLRETMTAAELEATKKRLEQSARDQGLDRGGAGDGQRTFSRKRYTCPLFQGRELGCPLPSEAKPYGCLAFNPVAAGVKARDCASGPGLLEARGRETLGQEAALMAELVALGARDDAKAIPVALLEIAGLGV
jgi:hypothetical protein